jgi:hypothetical protein
VKSSPGAWALPVVLMGAFVAALFGPYLLRTGVYGFIDCDFHLAWQLVVNDALFAGELLHWNPYWCGGVPALANPQSGALAPGNLLALLGLSPPDQMKVEHAAHMGICGLGMWLLARRFRAPPLASVLGFMVVVGGGNSVFFAYTGNTNYYAYYLTPLLVVLSIHRNAPEGWGSGLAGRLTRGWPTPLATLGGIGVVTLMLLEDGVYPLMQSFLILGALLTLQARQKKSLGPLLLLGVWGAVPILIGAVRALPVYELLSAYPRQVTHRLPSELWVIVAGFLHPDQYALHFENPFMDQGHWYYSAYEAYVGPIPFLLAGFALWRGRRSLIVRALGCLVLVAFVCELGHFAPWAPWSLATSLPGVDMFGAPYRFSWVIVQCLGLLSIIGARALHEWATHRWGRGPRPQALLLLLVVALGACLTYTSRPLISDFVRPYGPPHAVIDRSKPFTQLELDRYWASSYPAVADNFGVLNAFRGIEMPVNARQETREAYLEGGGGSASLKTRPNVLVIDVDADRPCWLVVNQNHHRDWTVEQGPPLCKVENRRGLIALRVPEGRQRLRLRFQPRAFRVGLVVSAVSLVLLVVACAGITFWRRRDRAKAYGSARET